MKKIIYLFLPVLVILFSCGRGDAPLPPERPFGNIHGNAVDALIVNGSLSVYDFENGHKGELLGTTITNEFGAYELSLQSKDRPVLLEVTGGYYTEEASGKRVILKDGQSLRAVTFYVSGEPLEVMVTPFTNLAAGLVVFKIAQSINVSVAITEASSAITSFMGLDILGTYPRNITDSNNASSVMTDEHRYGFFTAGLSALTRWISEENNVDTHSIYTSIALAQLMYRDISTDGQLDGAVIEKDAKNSLSFGKVPLNANVYRADLARHIISMASSPENKTGLGVVDVLDQATDISQTTHAVFAGVEPHPVDVTGPVISALEVEDSYKGGVFAFAVAVSDFVGIKTVVFDVDDEELGSAAVPANPTIEIDSTIFPDGDHLIGVQAIDNVGNESYSQFAIKIDNSNPFVNVTSPTIVNDNDYIVSGTYADQGAGLDAIYVNGALATKNTDGTWFKAITLAPGINTIAIKLIDRVGNIFETESNVALDIQPPIISLDYSEVMFKLNNSIYPGLLSDADNNSAPIYFDYNNLSILGLGFNTLSFAANDVPFYKVTVDDPFSNGISTSHENLTVQYSYRLNGNVKDEFKAVTLSDDFADSDAYLIPLANETMAENWYQAKPDDVHTIVIKVTDGAGNETFVTDSFKADFDLQDIQVISTQRGASANLYAFEDGIRGGLIGSCTTDNKGECSYGLYSQSKPILIEVNGGNIIEAATGYAVDFNADQGYRTIVLFESQDVNAIVTPITHVATAYVMNKLSQSVGFEQVYAEAKTVFQQSYGFDVFSVVPVDITKPTSINDTLTPGHRYGFQLAALSQFTAWANTENKLFEHEQYTTYSLANAMYQDIVFDGELNGKAIDGILSLGTVVLNDYQYRLNTGLQLLEFTKGIENRSGFDVAEVFDYANGVSRRATGIYGNKAGYDLDASGPTISLTIANTWQMGIVSISPDVTDDGGIASVSFDIDGNVLGEAVDPLSPVYRLDSAAYVDGEHVVGITAVDDVDNVSYRQFIFSIDNTSAEILLTSAIKTNDPEFLVSGTVNDSGAGIQNIVVDGVTASINADNVWSAKVNLSEEGSNSLNLIATDVVGNVTNTTAAVLLDRVSPNVVVISASQTATSLFTVSGTVFDEGAGIQSITVEGESANINEDGTWSVDVNLNQEGSNSLNLIATDVVDNVTNTTAAVLLDRVSPNVVVISASQTATSLFTVSGTVFDEGAGIQSITVEGESANINEDGTWSVDVNLNQEGSNSLNLIATDVVGNVTNTTVAVLLDRVSPNVVVTSASQTATSLFTVSGTVFDEGTGIQTIVVDGESANINEDGTWSVDVNLKQEGSNSLNLIATDVVGNVTNTTVAVLLDRVSPNVVVISASQTATSLFTVSGTVFDEGAGIQSITVEGESANINEDGTWSVDVNLNQEGSNSLNLIATDVVGNVTNTTAAVLLDRVSPYVVVMSASQTANPLFTVSGTVFDEGAGIQTIVVEGESANINEDGTWSVDVNLNQEGSNSLNLIATDVVGNATNTTVAVFLDTIAPEISINSSSVTNTASYSVGGSITEEGAGIQRIVVNGASAVINPDKTWWANVILTQEGSNTVSVVATDRVGNTENKNVSVLLDTIASAITMTSSQYVGSASYTAIGSYVEDGSGVSTIKVNGNTANVDPETKIWSYSLSLLSGDNTVNVVIEDIAGNTQNISKIVTYDVAPPKASVLYGLAKYSDGGGGYFNGSMASATNSGAPLYIVTDNISIGENNLTTGILDQLSIPYIALNVSDSVLGTNNTANGDLLVKMQYKLNGTIKKSWAILDPVINSVDGGGYLIPMTSEGLDSSWLSATATDVHRVEIEITDRVGNQKIYGWEFKVEFVAPALEVNVVDINSFNQSFANRALLHNKELVSNTYSFENSSDSYLYVKVSDTSVHSANLLIEHNQRENKVRLKSQDEWKVRTQNLTYQINDIGATLTNNISDWRSTSAVQNWNGNAWVTLAPPSSYNSVISVASDTVAPPPSTDWSNKTDVDSSRKGEWDSEYLLHLTYDFRLVSDANSIVWLCYGNGYNQCQYGTSYNWQKRTNFSYVTETGYPRNNPSSTNSHKNFSTTRFEARDSNNQILPTVSGAWYKVQPNQSVTITKYITTPSFTVYSDSEVLDLNSFSSYSKLSHDKNLTWNVSRPITITRVAGDAVSPKGLLLTTEVGSGSKTYNLER